MQLSCDNVHIRNYMYAVANWGFSTITWKSGRPVSVKDQVSQKLKRAWCYSVVKQDWVWKLQVGWLQMTTNITQNFNVKILPLFFSAKLGFSCFKGCANIIIPLQCSPLWNWSSMYSRYQGCPSFSVTKYVKIPLKAFLVNRDKEEEWMKTLAPQNFCAIHKP